MATRGPRAKKPPVVGEYALPVVDQTLMERLRALTKSDVMRMEGRDLDIAAACLIRRTTVRRSGDVLVMLKPDNSWVELPPYHLSQNSARRLETYVIERYGAFHWRTCLEIAVGPEDLLSPEGIARPCATTRIRACLLSVLEDQKAKLETLQLIAGMERVPSNPSRSSRTRRKRTCPYLPELAVQK